MRIQVNGSWREVPSAALAAALSDLGYGDALVTTALNGEFVASEARVRTLLADGDRLEILAPMQGG
jgi:sulfur carrier protein